MILLDNRAYVKYSTRLRFGGARLAGMDERVEGEDIAALTEAIGACRLCAPAFAATATGHAPRPVPWLSAAAPILLCGQAPGAKVHARGAAVRRPLGRPAARLARGGPRRLLRPAALRGAADGVLLPRLRRQAARTCRRRRSAPAPGGRGAGGDAGGAADAADRRPRPALASRPRRGPGDALRARLARLRRRT